MVLWIILVIIVLLAASAIIFINTSPQFGRKPKGADLERIKNSPNYSNGEFLNPIRTEMGSFSEMMRTIPKFFRTKNGKPSGPLPVKFGQNKKKADESTCYITWFGHSAFLLELEGKRILLDPMLGKVAAPVSWGSKRFQYEKPIPVDELTAIDAAILSHDHYDHLDYSSIMKLKKEVGHFYTSLGVGSHLRYWGIPGKIITELDWWQKTEYKDLEIIACPARHFSGRGPGGRYTTLWSGWVIKGQKHKIFFNADSGYGPHFKEIGEKQGPFDFAMLECGQYNEAWEAFHMMPEQTVKAGIDIQAKLMMPIHWGAFKLSVHPWTEPVKRFRAECERLNASFIHPYIGERFRLGEDYPKERWWEF